MAAALAADTVAGLLRGAATRAATLDALERHETGAIDRAVSLAAAPALFELQSADAAEVGREIFDRVGLLAARLTAEATPDDAAVVYGAYYGSPGRFAAHLRAEGSVLARAWRKPAAELTQADARSWACEWAFSPPAFVRGITEPIAAAGFASTGEFFGIWMSEDPMQM